MPESEGDGSAQGLPLRGLHSEFPVFLGSKSLVFNTHLMKRKQKS